MTDNNQGYITLATTESEVRNAANLAISLRLCDRTRPICLVIPQFDIVPSKYEDLFDFIVQLPFGNTSANDDSLMVNVWQLFYCTPFDETLFVSPYTIATANIESFWDTTMHDDLIFPVYTINFKNEQSSTQSRNLVFESNQLESIYSDIFFFKQSKRVSDFFKMADVVFQNWRAVFQQFIKEHRPAQFDLSVAFSLSGYLLGESLKPTVDQLTYITLAIDSIEETELQDEWRSHLNVWVYNGNQIKVNNFRQLGFFVYNDYKLITDRIENDLRNHKKAIRHN